MNRGLSLVGAAVTPPVEPADAPTAISAPTAAITFAPTAAADYVAAAAPTVTVAPAPTVTVAPSAPSRTVVNAVGDAIGFAVRNAPTSITIVVAGNTNTVPVHALCAVSIVMEVVPDVSFTVGA